MDDLITAPAAHVEARSQNAGLVTTRTISTRRDDAHRTSPTLTPSAGASSELANRHSHLPVGRALEEQLFLPPAARGIASFAAVCAAIFAMVLFELLSAARREQARRRAARFSLP